MRPWRTLSPLRDALLVRGYAARCAYFAESLHAGVVSGPRLNQGQTTVKPMADSMTRFIGNKWTLRRWVYVDHADDPARYEVGPRDPKYPSRC